MNKHEFTHKYNGAKFIIEASSIPSATYLLSELVRHNLDWEWTSSIPCS